MLRNLLQTVKNQIPATVQTRGYAHMGGKLKMDKKDLEGYSKEEITNINIHAQLTTDFNIIYEKDDEIRIFAVGNLHTKKTLHSTQISERQNYVGDGKPQNLTFLKKSIEVHKDLHIIQKSKEYFDKYRECIEKDPEYKVMFNEVLEELKSLGIKARVAETPEEMENTGFNILLKKQSLKDKNELFSTLTKK